MQLVQENHRFEGLPPLYCSLPQGTTLDCRMLSGNGFLYMADSTVAADVGAMSAWGASGSFYFGGSPCSVDAVVDSSSINPNSLVEHMQVHHYRKGRDLREIAYWLMQPNINISPSADSNPASWVGDGKLLPEEVKRFKRATRGFFGAIKRGRFDLNKLARKLQWEDDNLSPIDVDVMAGIANINLLMEQRKKCRQEMATMMGLECSWESPAFLVFSSLAQIANQQRLRTIIHNP